MKNLYHIYLSLILLLFANTMQSQYINVDDTLTAEQLVKNVFAKSGCAKVENFTVNGGPLGPSYGYFTSNGSGFPFSDGIVLSTSRAISTIGPNSTTTLSEGPTSWPGDADLEQALNVTGTYNATILEFDFIPNTTKISFDYIFASEQYLPNPSANQCGYTDGFAFLLKKEGATTYDNLALVPGTTIPVAVNTIRGSGTICPAANPQYFDAFNGVNNPTRFNGQTKILKAQSDVEIGQKYHIKLVIADQGNEKFDSGIFLGGGSFQSETFLGDDRIIDNKNPYCSGETVILDATQTGTNTYKWFKNGSELLGEVNPTYTITDNTNNNIVEYTVEVNINGSCLSNGKIKVQFAALPNVAPQSITQCDNDLDGISTFDLSKLDNGIKTADPTIQKIVYTETSGGIPIPDSDITKFTSGSKTIYVEVYNAYNCKRVSTVNLQVLITPVKQFTYEKCDTDTTVDGFTAFDLNTEITSLILSPPTTSTLTYYKTLQQAIEQNQPLPNLYTNTIKDVEIIYGRVNNGVNCVEIYEITLKVNYIPRANFGDEIAILCSNETITLSFDNTYVSYIWSNGSQTNQTSVSIPNIYTVEVTDINGCKAIKKYFVNPSAIATNIDAEIKEFSENNSILITYTDNGGDYEFSIDGQTFQDNPLFTNLASGEYLISVRDKNGCQPSPTKTIYILDFPKFFTPNNDGYNDTWSIKNIDKRSTISSINIFDKYGKLIKYITPSTQGWDGIYSGQNLPSDDYWFIINFINGHTVKSHFTLKR